ncbi:hypothetical protein K501DRAFT_328494 [Backusella circina FSU 941]|nr:hypothetical protein K501DRAFT_328494 [Backusella circina FSU 941]
MSDSEDEYGPIQSTWGSQTPAAANEAASWDALRDPNAKLTEKGLGTGQLHRKGRNFKPVDEEIIISQRLQKNNSKKKGNTTRSFSQDNPSTTKDTQNHKKASLPVNSASQHQKARNNKKASFSTPTSPPMRSTTSLAGRISRPAKPNSAWSKPLVDTPFWESDLSYIPSPQSTHLSPPQSSNSMNNYNKNQDTQHQQQHLHHNNSNNQNSGWAKPVPRKPLLNESSSVTEQWSPPQIPSNGGWGNVDASSKGGWSNNNEEQQGWSNNNKEMDESATQPTLSDNNNKSSGNGSAYNNDKKHGWGTHNDNGKSDWRNVNKATPSWLDSVPENTSNVSSPTSPPLRSQEGDTGIKSKGRFSNKSRKKYSDIPIEVPKPRNYDKDEPVSFPTAVAPPPPPENDHLITINVELSDTIKVVVPIRELDEPVQLAKKFAAEQNLQSPQVLQAIIKLFTSQKDAALLKKRQKLVKKYPSRPHATNYYTDAFDYPEYLPTVYNSAPSLTTPFTRRAYY